MSTVTYDDAVRDALTRLRGVGYEHGPALVNHAPMAAEAMAQMGYTDAVPAWLERNLRQREYHEPPPTRWVLSADDWADALGDFSRVADWTAMFERELGAEPWRPVLARWWPRLLPGMSGALTHGVIRTAHAVRALAVASGDDALQRAELAHGLGYWAARYSTRFGGAGGEPEPAGDPSMAIAALDELVADSSGFYARAQLTHAVPLIHAITAPAAVRLVCLDLPDGLRWTSYAAAHRCSQAIRAHFAGRPSGEAGVPAELPSDAELVAAAVEVGDEHAIKLAEVAARHNAIAPDPRYAAASYRATAEIRISPP